jgi:hypothetical protein
MVPVKAKTLIPVTAEKLGVDAEIVGKVVNGYYSYVRELATDLTDLRLRIPLLGTLCIKEWLLDKRITQIEEFEERTRLTGVVKNLVREKKESELWKLQRLKSIWEEDQKRKEEHKLKRLSYEQTKVPDSSPAPDNSGLV